MQSLYRMQNLLIFSYVIYFAFAIHKSSQKDISEDCIFVMRICVLGWKCNLLFKCFPHCTESPAQSSFLLPRSHKASLKYFQVHLFILEDQLEKLEARIFKKLNSTAKFNFRSHVAKIQNLPSPAYSFFGFITIPVLWTTSILWMTFHRQLWMRNWISYGYMKLPYSGSSRSGVSTHTCSCSQATEFHVTFQVRH